MDTNDNDKTKAPKEAGQIAREKELQERHDAMVPPAPEVDTEATPVPRAELMTPLPKEGKDVNPWKPGKENVKHLD